MPYDLPTVCVHVLGFNDGAQTSHVHTRNPNLKTVEWGRFPHDFTPFK